MRRIDVLQQRVTRVVRFSTHYFLEICIQKASIEDSPEGVGLLRLYAFHIDSKVRPSPSDCTSVISTYNYLNMSVCKKSPGQPFSPLPESDFGRGRAGAGEG